MNLIEYFYTNCLTIFSKFALAPSDGGIYNFNLKV